MQVFKFTLVIAGALCVLGGAAKAQDDIAKLSDEFDSEASAAQWQHIHRVEGWNADQLELFDINKVYKGHCAMMPFSSGWYQDWRGALVFKPIKGDFVMTTKVKVTGRDGKSAPRSLFSLAGIMVRAPRNITPQTWQPGGENHVFVSLGVALQPGIYSYEFKSTRHSKSDMKFPAANANESQLQIARIGAAAIVLVKTDQTAWRILARFARPDLPDEVQAGMTLGTDWPTVEKVPPRQHNAMVIRNGRPDLGALYDYLRFRRPVVPAALQGRDLSNPNEVSDADLLRFLGETAAIGSGSATQPATGFAAGAAAP